MRRDLRSTGGWILAIALALALAPALLRATQRLGHGPNIKQVCGFSTSVLDPAQPDSQSLIAAAPAPVSSFAPPAQCGVVLLRPVFSGSVSVPVPSGPRAPPTFS